MNESSYTYNEYSLPRVLGESPVTGRYKTVPEDFAVTEILGFSPEFVEKGQQHWLRIRKTGVNTGAIEKQLARALGIHPRDIGYSGMKDRMAVTEQWFSVQLPALQSIDWPVWFSEHMHGDVFPGGEVTLLEAVRSHRKLRRGVHKANHFCLRVRELTHKDDFIERVAQLAEGGAVANYFGPQRFGKQGDNVAQALRMIDGEFQVRDRKLRSILLSSVRSYLFNQYLAQRIQSDLPALCEGDVVILDGSQSYFTVGDDVAAVAERLAQGDVQVSGPMFGESSSPAQGRPAALEQKILAQYAELHAGLCAARMGHERRPLWLRVSDLSLVWLDDSVAELRFTLPAGAFATSVLAELGQFSEGNHANFTQQ
ncbi:tRNA pseudouridine(13) synthase TruD [Aliidiomarina halalkaliphila]|uniref:tRNA pseudouridine synthase D n=1 Tax=Aliidiomarina halalkaliphila TaxID=2593535 RepID=A0A552X3M2_9GAMM|nr:tRNA pseudouridine(13) synthase TruD [Aliidiomarina halalkaliphila]TRW49612.1 tRNA pseudouridine(13) synthase TruD [Aliidiomarina halalkaliphila]